MDVSHLADDFDALTKLFEHSAECCRQKHPSTTSNVKSIETATPRSAVHEQCEKRRFKQCDGRTVPICDVLYRQAVESGDVFLGLSGKTPSSVSCEALLVKISLPEQRSLDDLKLECKENRVLLESHLYKLFHCLPHKVNGEQGTAKWHSEQRLLEITLPIVRPDPFTE